ncbi:MAG: N-6 DNA methylase, partial [Enterococcus faecalis]|nr:N-6 DNA methylase [Enterococcus faecalis]
EKLKKQNHLRLEDVDKIVDTVVQRKEIEKYSHLATLDEIKENDYNLNIPRYVDTYEEEPPVDLVALNNDIKNTNEEIKKVEAELLSMLDDLVVTEETQALIDATKEVFGG